ncbi:hypothetical protein AAC387_Pa01g1835 [Persea americana]
MEIGVVSILFVDLLYFFGVGSRRKLSSSLSSSFKDAGMDWIIHLDTDELLHPASAREYSLRQVLLDVPSNVDMVIFPNYRSKGLIRSETKQTAEELQNEDLWLKEEAERMRFQPHTSNRPNWSEASLQMLMDAINVRMGPLVTILSPLRY